MFRNHFFVFLKLEHPFPGCLFGTVETLRYLFRSCKVFQFVERVENVSAREILRISVFHLYLQSKVTLLFLTVILS